MLALELRIAASLLEIVAVRRIQMAQRLLKCDTICLPEPGILLLQDMCEILAGIGIADRLMPRFPGVFPVPQVVIEHETAAAKALLKELSLTAVWICTIFVSSNPFHAANPPEQYRTYVLIISLKG